MNQFQDWYLNSINSFPKETSENREIHSLFWMFQLSRDTHLNIWNTTVAAGIFFPLFEEQSDCDHTARLKGVLTPNQDVFASPRHF